MSVVLEYQKLPISSNNIG